VERLILDTGALIALERGHSGQTAVLRDDADVAISAVTASELLLGVELATQTYRDRRNTRSVGQLRGAHDLQIGATARATGRTVVTTDAQGFDGLPGVAARLLS
jgi:tRNA(fMet)-specific endonuclease VapC